MKKILVTAILFFIFVSAGTVHAYNWYAGTSLGFNSSDTDSDNSSSDFSIMPEIGYIINDKFDVGIGGSFATSTAETAGVSEDATEWGITPFVRYAAYRSGRFTLYARAQIGYSAVDYDTADDESTFSAGLAPVVEFAVSDRITLFTSLMFIEYSKTDAGDDSTTYFGINADMNDLIIGFSVNF